MNLELNREEIQRIKAAKPDIPHREAFSMAAKNVSLNPKNYQLQTSKLSHNEYLLIIS